MGSSTIKEKIKWLYQKLINRETIAYGVAGILTTIVNFASYEGLYELGVPNLTANALAWVVAVVFAYIVNKKNVFLSRSHNVKDEAAKVSKFFGARVITLLIEQAGMYLFTELLTFNRLIVKACLAVIIIVLNYIFSKLYIFNNKSTQKYEKVHAMEQEQTSEQEQEDEQEQVEGQDQGQNQEQDQEQDKE